MQRSTEALAAGSTSRRAFVAGSATLVTARWAGAQTTGRTYRLGWLATVDIFHEPYSEAFVRRLGQLGFLEGKNLSIVFRQAAGRVERLPALAGELVKLNCDALFAGGLEASLVALKRASRHTPIVFVAVDFDPVATGHVASLARPGDLVTGITAVQSILPGKRLELLKELIPDSRKVAVFTNDQTGGQLAVAQDAARRLGLTLHVIEFKRQPFDYGAGVLDATRVNADALFVLGSGLFVEGRRKIPELALKAKLPPDANIRLAGSADHLQATVATMAKNFILALIVLFMLMAAMFRSLRDALVVVLTVPVALVGGVLGLRVLGAVAFQPLDLLTMIGFIMMVGVIVNHSILLVDRTRDAQNHGHSLEESIRLGFKPSDALDFYNLGCFQASKEQYGKAADAFEKALKQNPTLLQAQYNLALAQEMAGEIAAARKSWNAYLDKCENPDEAAEIKDHLTELANR